MFQPGFPLALLILALASPSAHAGYSCVFSGAQVSSPSRPRLVIEVSPALAAQRRDLADHIRAQLAQGRGGLFVQAFDQVNAFLTEAAPPPGKVVFALGWEGNPAWDASHGEDFTTINGALNRYWNGAQSTDAQLQSVFTHEYGHAIFEHFLRLRAPQLARKRAELEHTLTLKREHWYALNREIEDRESRGELTEEGAKAAKREVAPLRDDLFRAGLERTSYFKRVISPMHELFANVVEVLRTGDGQSAHRIGTHPYRDFTAQYAGLPENLLRGDREHAGYFVFQEAQSWLWSHALSQLPPERRGDFLGLFGRVLTEEMDVRAAEWQRDLDGRLDEELLSRQRSVEENRREVERLNESLIRRLQRELGAFFVP